MADHSTTTTSTNPTEAPSTGAGTRRIRSALLLAIALGLTLILSGCSLQSFGMSKPTSSASGSSSSKAATSAPAGSSSASSASASSASSAAPKAVALSAPVVRGALANGSAVHHVDAGTRTLLVNYWTTQNPATWTSDKSVPINVSAHFATGSAKSRSSKVAVYVTAFHATLGVIPSGTVTTLRNDTGRFVLTAPYSYNSVLVLPGQPSTATAATISVEFDLLVETAAGSHQYYRQTVLDTLPLTFVSSTRGTSS